MGVIRSFQDASKLPKGKLVHAGNEVPFTQADVRNGVRLVLAAHIGMSFDSQAEILCVAGNTLGWGKKSGYATK